MSIKQSCLIVFLLLVSLSLKAQELESYPASIKWWQLNTPHFKVIYPSSALSDAQRIANSLEHFYVPAASSLDALPRRIRIVVNNQTAVSNGFVSMAPRRSEIFTAPPQDYNLGGSLKWLPFVSLHEYRHIVQFQRSYAGLSKLSFLLFGPEAFNVMAVLSVPIWFLEGDAVVTETAMSHSGRGRNPEFDMEFRTPLLLRDKPYSYSKQYLGSYKDYIPDHYRLGYFMSAYVRDKYGKDIWSPIVRQANAHSFLPFTFSVAMKRNTGKYLMPTYKEMMSDMRRRWNEKRVNEEEVEYLTDTSRRIFTNYSFPQEIGDGRIVVVRSGLGDIQQFVAISNNGEEDHIFTPGVMNRSPMLSTKAGRIVWTEFVPDFRWPKKVYSSVKLYNMDSKEVYILTLEENYASADISNDLSQIVSVYTPESGPQQITLLQGLNGVVIKRFNNPDNAFYQQPRFTEDGSRIVAVKITEKGKSLVSLDIETGIENQLTQISSENIGHPVPYKDYVLFNSQYNGVDNIHAIKLSSGELFQVTEAEFGAFNPMVTANGEYIYFNLFGSKGLDLVRKPFDPASWRNRSQSQDRSIGLAETLSQQEGEPELVTNIPENSYESKRYRRLRGFVNPTSWGPYVDATTRELFIGMRSQDILSNIAWQAGYIYDNSEETESWRANFTYQGIYTPINSSLTYGKRTEFAVYRAVTDSTIGPAELTELSWYETEVEAGLSLPINFTNGKNFARFNVSNSVSVIHKEGYMNPGEGPNNVLLLPVSQGNGNIVANNFSISFSRLWRQSKRDINSRFGQYFSLRPSWTLGNNFDGAIITLRTGFFFPGFIKHHSLFIKGGVQYQKLTFEENLYRFRNRIEFPRGFQASSFNTYYYGSINYALPLLYPDLAIGPLAYIQRIKANVFADFGSGSRTIKGSGIQLGPENIHYRSAGMEITVDFNVFRLPFPIDAGVRFNFMNDPFGIGQDPFSYEFLIASFGF